jgi:hypothetical protein
MHRVDKMPNKSNDSVKKPSKLPMANTEQGNSLYKYTMKDVELGLQLLALNGGNAAKTAAQLEENHKLHVPANTLKRWANIQFTNRYNTVAHELRNTISQDLASKLTANAQRSADITETLLDSLADEVDDLEPIEKARVAKDISQVGSTSLDKSLLLRGQPTDISVAMSPEDIVAELQKMSVRVESETGDGEGIQGEDAILPEDEG